MYDLLYGPSDAVHLPTHYGEIVHTDVMTRGHTMVKDGGGGPEVFLKPFHQMSLQIPLCMPY